MSKGFIAVLAIIGIWFTGWLITEGLYGDTNMWQLAAGFVKPVLFGLSMLMGWATYRGIKALWRAARRINFKTTRDA